MLRFAKSHLDADVSRLHAHLAGPGSVRGHLKFCCILVRLCDSGMSRGGFARHVSKIARF